MLARLVPSLEMRRTGFVDRWHEPALFTLRDLHLALDTFHRSQARAP